MANDARTSHRRTVVRSTFSLLATLAVTIVVGVPSPSASAPRPWSHERPPPVGTRLAPRRGLFLCESVDGARRSAETGFLAAGCAPLERRDWTVIRCHEDTLSHGPIRLLEVTTPDRRRGWVPLPWHDWA